MGKKSELTNPIESDAYRAVMRAFDAPLSPVDQARAYFAQTYELSRNAPESKRAAIDAEFTNFAAKVIELRRGFDDGHGLMKAVATLHRSVSELLRPAPDAVAPTNYDQAMSMYQARLVAGGWNSTLASMVCVEAVRRKSAIKSFDAVGVTFADGERVLRSWLIQVNAPKEEPFRSNFLANFPEDHNGPA